MVAGVAGAMYVVVKEADNGGNGDGGLSRRVQPVESMKGKARRRGEAACAEANVSGSLISDARGRRTEATVQLARLDAT